MADNDSAFCEMENGVTKFRHDDPSRPPSIVSSTLSYDVTGLDEGLGNMQRMEDEAIPNIEYYSGTMSVKKVASRPTMRDLHDERKQSQSVELSPSRLATQTAILKSKAITEPITQSHAHKFGWVRGVLIRCILSILGTLLYLRMGWIAGRAGLGMATLIVAVSACITTITALSMSALCTNGEIRAGGAYFMLSRSLGPEFGGTMGVVFALADAIASAMNVVGFAECVRDILKDYGLMITDGSTNDVRIIALITELAIFTIVMISVSWEAKIELALICIVIISFADFLIGTVIPPTLSQKTQGFTGYSWENLKTNFHSEWRGETFVTMFALYFPSITGILSGAGISGELREPNTAIPKGTLLGILTTTLVYLSAIWLTGVTAVRDSTGDLGQYLNGTAFHCPGVEVDKNCSKGLQNDYQIMFLESGWWPLILAGVFGTSISSALTLLVSAPRTIQALCGDKLFPHTAFLAKGSARDNEPRRAYILVLLIGLIMIAVGSLNDITPLISNFYLATFLLINYACFDGSLAKSPGWRPAFKYYNMWVSLFGAALCGVAMFVMSWPTALATLVFMAFLYVFLLRRKPDVNWGSSSQSHVYRQALQGMLNLMITPEHVKTWRPQILCLTGHPIARCCMADFVSNITRSGCLLICGNIILPGQERLPEGSMQDHVRHIYAWFKQRKLKAFYSPAPAPNFYDGVKMLIQTAGLGKLQPNILFVGFKNNWRHCQVEETIDYVKMIHEAFDANLGLCILRLPGGLDCAEMLQRYEVLESTRFHEAQKNTDKNRIPALHVPPNVSYSTMDALHTAESMANDQSPNPDRSLAPAYDTLRPHDAITPTARMSPESERKEKLPRRDSDISIASSCVDFMAPITVTPPASSSLTATPDDRERDVKEKQHDPKPLMMIEEIGQRMRSFRKRHHLTPAQREVVFAMNQFREKMKKAIIDVYWLFDDGGLTVLIPHLLTLEKSFLEKAHLRIFTLSSTVGNVKKEEEKLKAMLTLFRISFEDVIVLTDWHLKPKSGVIADFENTIAPYRVTSLQSEASSFKSLPPDAPTPHPEFCITDAEKNQLKDKTDRYLRTREIVMEHSKDAQMIVITAPVPKKGKVSACMYMAWLDMLSRDLTPFNAPVLLIRGNQQSVLTFYS